MQWQFIQASHTERSSICLEFFILIHSIISIRVTGSKFVPSCTEGDPTETVENGCDTPRGSVCVVVAHEPCPSALDFIKCVYILLGVGIQSSC